MKTGSSRVLLMTAAAFLSFPGKSTLATESKFLIKENQPLLCASFKVGEGSERYVAPSLFYSMVLAKSEIPPIVVANAIGRGQQPRSLVLDSDFPDEIDAGQLPNASPELVQKLKKLAKGKLAVLKNFALETDGVEAKRAGYEVLVINTDQTSGPQINVPKGTEILLQEARSPNIPKVVAVIRCIEPVEERPIAEEANERIDKFFGDFRLRRDRSELALTAQSASDTTTKERTKEVGSAKLATVSFAQDLENDTQTVGAEAVLGYRLGNATPFLGIEFQDKNGKDEDIGVIFPGLFYDRLLGEPIDNVKMYYTASIFTVIDIEQKGERIALTNSLEPATFLGNGFALGAYGKPFDAPFLVKPALHALVEASHVLDSGSNERFKDANNFLGLGAKVGLKFIVPDVPVLESATLSVDYRFQQLFFDDDSLLDQFEISLDWTPKDTPYFGVSISYNIGENDTTLQDEETFSLSLGARF